MDSREGLQTSKNLQLREHQTEVVKWINHKLLSAGYNSDQLVADIGVEMTDGLTLIRLVQYITGQSIINYHSSPLMRRQKIDNINLCLSLLQNYGCPVNEIFAEDIVSGNMMATLSLCHSLMGHFKSLMLGAQYKGNETKARLMAPLNHESKELLNWVGDVIHQNIPDFKSFYDGHVLCDLVNSVHHKAIDYKDLTNLSPLQCLQVAFSAAETHLGISRGTIDLHKLASGQEDHKLKSYLQHFKMIHQHEAKRKLRNSLLGIEQDSKVQANKYKTNYSSVPPPRPKRATSEAFLSSTLPRDFGSNNDVRQALSTEYLNSKSSTGTLGRPKQRDSFGSNRSERFSTNNQYPSRIISPRHTTTTVERSYSSDIPLPVTIYRTSSRSSIHSTSSRSSMDRSTDDHQLPVTHLANLSSSIIPSHMLPFDNDSDIPSEYPSNNVTLDDLFRMVVNFNDHLKDLSQSIDEKTYELEHKLLLAIQKEKKQRELLEKKHEKLTKRGRYITQHYDGCLIELAKEVAHIKGQFGKFQDQLSSIVAMKTDFDTRNTEISLLKQRVLQVEEYQTFHQSQPQPVLFDSHSSQPTSYIKQPPIAMDRGKKNLFSRKMQNVRR